MATRQQERQEELARLVRAQSQQDRRSAANATTRSPQFREVSGTVSPTSPMTSVDLTQGPFSRARPAVTENNSGVLSQAVDAGLGLFNTARQMTPSAIGGRFLDEALNGMSAESDRARDELSSTIPSGIWNSMSNAQRDQMARDVVQERNAAPNTKAAGDAFGRSTGSGAGGGAGGGNNAVGTTANVDQQGDAVSRLQEARQPRGLTFSNLFGSTRFDPETGEFIQADSDQFQQFQTGLLGQLTSAQDAFQSFNPQDAASEYLRGVNAIREPLREQQTQSSLSRLIQSGRLGASSGTRALAQLEQQQENQRFGESQQAIQFGQEQQNQLFNRQQGLFGLAQNVAQQQFGGQQAALGAVPLLQEIFSFPEEPAFQRDLAQMGIDAQRSANQSSLFGDIFKVAAPFIFG